MSDKQPTAGAMRAAEAIMPLPSVPDRGVRKVLVVSMADIIDRESGLRELVTVVEDLLDSLEADHYNATSDSWDEESAATSAYEARHAIARVQKAQP